MSWTIDLPIDDLSGLPPLPGDMAERFADVISHQALQQPSWDAHAAISVRRILESAPPIVVVPEVRKLRQEPADVANGKAFLLQGGDCTGTFESNTEPCIRANVKILLQMAVALTYGASTPVVKTARITGRYAKPRSKDIDGDGLLNYRGDIVNGVEPTEETRVHDLARTMRAYANVSAAMNLVRILTGSGAADLHRLHKRNRELVSDSPAGTRYEGLAREIGHALQFMTACSAANSNLQATQIYCSHKALVVDYERTMLRLSENDDNQELFNLSTYQLWIGERTRSIEDFRVNLAAMIGSPVGARIGPATIPEEAVAYADRPDPFFQPGRLALTSRLGSDKVRSVLPPIVETVEASGHRIIWQCDSMRDNTYLASSGYKTRHFGRIVDEVRDFFEMHRPIDSHPDGIHMELTGEDVAEYLGDAQDISDIDLPGHYASVCDPCLDAQQSLELALLVAEMLRNWLQPA